MMMVWFVFLICGIVIVIVICLFALAKTFVRDNKKIRIYISEKNISEIENALLYRPIHFDKEYQIRNTSENMYKIIFLDSSTKKKICYNIRILEEGKYTVVLVQYDKTSENGPISFELLDKFMFAKMDVKLK